MAQFKYKDYQSAPSKKVAQWDADNMGFTIIVGTPKSTFQNKMDKAGMTLLRYGKFHIRKDIPTLEMVSYGGDANYKNEWLNDAQQMKLEILKMQVEEFINDYPFSGEGFTKWARTLMRPFNDSGCKYNKSWVKKYGSF